MVQGDYLLPYKDFSKETNFVSYSSDVIKDNDDLNSLGDSNKKTFIEIDSEKDKEIELEFVEILPANSLDFEFSYQSDFYEPRFFVAEEKGEYSRVDQKEVNDFPIKYVKIEFVSKKKDLVLREKIKIFELGFWQVKKEYVIKSWLD